MPGRGWRGEERRLPRKGPFYTQNAGRGCGGRRCAAGGRFMAALPRAQPTEAAAAAAPPRGPAGPHRPVAAAGGSQPAPPGGGCRRGPPALPRSPEVGKKHPESPTPAGCGAVASPKGTVPGGLSLSNDLFLKALVLAVTDLKENALIFRQMKLPNFCICFAA